VPDPFAVTDCALIAIATGEKAHNLRELLSRLIHTEDQEILYYHFWGGLLRPHFVDPEYPNDFAAWAYHDLHDRRLAEKLAILHPGRHGSMERLRRQMIDVIEDRLDEDVLAGRIEAEHPFFFLRSQIVVFDTGIRVERPENLADVIPALSASSIFYHLIDAHRRTASGENDFSEWMQSFDNHYRQVAGKISAIDLSFHSLTELREILSHIFHENFAA
jgi:hypothetical protein